MFYAIVGAECVMTGLSQLILEPMSQDLGRWKHIILRTIFYVPFYLSNINSLILSRLKRPYIECRKED
jgi:hypothetical protein